MADHLFIYLNGTVVCEFDKREGLARMQFAYVRRMDEHMDRGIDLNGNQVRSPDQQQRNHFVIGQLLDALRINDRRDLALFCRYLAYHAPTLDAIRVEENGDEYTVGLEFG